MFPFFEVKGIKCDNSNCSYNDNNVSPNEYENYINKPCPKCGQNLLTEYDYAEYKFFTSFLFNFLSLILFIFIIS